jgi:hypothetical protein
VEAAVFQKAFIPKTLGEVEEKCFVKDHAQGLENTYYATVTGRCSSPTHKHTYTRAHTHAYAYARIHIHTHTPRTRPLQVVARALR